MNDYEKFWIEVYIAAIRSGVKQMMAATLADIGLEAYKLRCKDKTFYN